MHELRAVSQFSVGAAVSDLKNGPHRGGSTSMFAAVKLEDKVSNRRTTSAARYERDMLLQAVC